MSHSCSAEVFLQLCAQGVPLLDVRSPQEFARAHIPGALNLPLFSDAQREAVGIAHAQGGTDAAVHKGLELVGPQLADKLSAAKRLCRDQRDVLMHCWRGGMRSSSMAWLLEASGFHITLLQGGYKAYRAEVHRILARPADVRVLGGMTGSGKTDILTELAALGCQTIDLEGLAVHRGSAFGCVGLGEQPSSEMFENQLAEQWAAVELSRPVWLEDEDKRIGNIALCPEFFSHIQHGRLIVIQVPHEGRVDRLTRLYAEGGCVNELLAAVQRLEKRLGSELCNACSQAIVNGDYALAVGLVLGYYDKCYARQLDKRGEPDRFLDFPFDDPGRAARRLAALEDVGPVFEEDMDGQIGERRNRSLVAQSGTQRAPALAARRFSAPAR